MVQIIYKDLSYEVMGCLFEVLRELGSGHEEKIYQKALAKEFKEKGLNFKEQVYVKIDYKGEKIGAYFLDFLIEGTIVLEIKRNPRFSNKDFEQIDKYLKTTGLKLGILASFTRDRVKYKRVLNLY